MAEIRIQTKLVAFLEDILRSPIGAHLPPEFRNEMDEGNRNGWCAAAMHTGRMHNLVHVDVGGHRAEWRKPVNICQWLT